MAATFDGQHVAPRAPLGRSSVQHPQWTLKGRNAVTSPFSSSLLNQPVEDAPRTPRAPIHTRSVTHVVAAPPQQQYYAPAAPQPVYVQAPRGGGLSAVALALVVILVGAVALVGGYYATRQASPSTYEAQLARGTAMRSAFQAGQQRGIANGRTDALANAESTIALRVAAARQDAYDRAYRNGMNKGRSSYHAPRYSGYRGYRGYRGNGFGNLQVASAFGQAQGLANLTGAPVDVEIY
jgi:hypothetical protein